VATSEISKTVNTPKTVEQLQQFGPTTEKNNFLEEITVLALNKSEGLA